MSKKEPARYPEYEPTPFWFYNDAFDKDEIVKQLDCMKENGICSFFLHVRDGKTVEEAYGTDLFFSQIKFIVEKAVERNIKVWLYYEDSYPSGNCGGKIVIDHPELASRVLVVEKIDVKNGIARKELGKVRGLYGYVVTHAGRKERVRIIKDCFGPTRKYWYPVEIDKAYYCDMLDLPFTHRRGETNYSKITFETDAPDNADVYVAYLKTVMLDERFGAQVDVLNPKATELFIENVHEKYKEYVGEYFGKEIPGIFFDEPWTSGAKIPYSDVIEEYFYKKYGYEIKENLYKLCTDYVGDYGKFSRDYIEACVDLFKKNFLVPVKKWCKKNKLKFTGHFVGEENPAGSVGQGQNLSDNITFMDVPGFDIIGTLLGSVERPALILGANIVSSVACQSGKKTILAECFALAPFNLDYYGEKRIADWLFVNGINWLVPHAFYYGYSAYRRSDAGKSYFYHDPAFVDYPKFASYAGRVGKLMHEYKRENDYLLIIPTGLFAEEINHVGSGVTNEKFKESQRIMYDFVSVAAKKRIAFDTAPVESVLTAEGEKGKIKIGNRTYSEVFVVKGGDEEELAYNILIGKKVKTTYLRLGDEPELISAVNVKCDSDGLLVYKKNKLDGNMIFAFNNSEDYAQYRVEVGANACIYDAETDKRLGVEIKNGFVNISLQPYESVIILTSEKEIPGVTGRYELKPVLPDRHPYLKDPQIYFTPIGCKGVVSKFDLEVEKDGNKKVFVGIKSARIRDMWGTQDKIYADWYKIPYYDMAPRPEAIYPVKATYKAKVPIKCGEKLLFDGDTFTGDFKLFWNGKEILEKDLVKARVYDRTNREFVPAEIKEENILEIKYESADEFDGINGEIYIME